MTTPPTGPLFVSFVAGQTGIWKIESVRAVAGEVLPVAARLDVREDRQLSTYQDGDWVLRGVVSNLRYTTGDEIRSLAARQEGLGRSEASRAALIPIRKSAEWWALAQDRRRAVIEEQSRHIGIGMDYLPGVARRLHHSRDLGEPFDFLTWFEYAPKDSAAFEELVRRLRETDEWKFVEREVDIRLTRE